MTPESGGYLEAVPLTSFVAMSLIAAGRGNHPAVPRNIAFICAQQRADGAWPIDKDLAIWVTTLCVNGLGGGDAATRDWLVAQQNKGVHPYTGSPPGGWGWTDASGSVPDADDTAGALLALSILPEPERALQTAELGSGWMLGLQNADGGWPTFCRGWHDLPFDRSAADLTAHALRALHAWQPKMPPGLGRRIDRAIARGIHFLEHAQRPDGAWTPLWFGNEHAPGEANPVFGTSRVLRALATIGRGGEAAARRGAEFLRAARNPDGSWGGAAGVPGSMEETALACEAQICFDGGGDSAAAGMAWLCRAVEERGFGPPEPIGLYFARLWYAERLYPAAFSTGALRAALSAQARGSS